MLCMAINTLAQSTDLDFGGDCDDNGDECDDQGDECDDNGDDFRAIKIRWLTENSPLAAYFFCLKTGQIWTNCKQVF